MKTNREPLINLESLLEGKIQNGYSPLPVENETGWWVLGLGALTTSGLDLSQIKPIVQNEGKAADKVLRDGDFLVSRSNTREKVGLASCFKGEIVNCIYPDLMMRFRADQSVVSSDYLDQFLRSPIAKHYFSHKAAGTSASMVKITKSILAKLPVFLPTLPEQKAIAELLSTWDEAIEKTERLVEAKECQFNRLIYELIGKRKPEISLGKVCKIEKGERFVNNENLIPYLEIGDIDVKTKDYSVEGKEKIPVLGAIKVPENTFLISTVRPTRGAMTLTKSEIYVSSAFCKLKIEGNFYFYCLHQKKFADYLKAKQSGATYPTVKDRDILNFKVPLMLDSEQKDISQSLDLAKRETDLLRKLAKQYRLQKRGLMQKLLTGKWRVSVNEETMNG